MLFANLELRRQRILARKYRAVITELIKSNRELIGEEIWERAVAYRKELVLKAEREKN
jgi:hypothetical protein